MESFGSQFGDLLQSLVGHGKKYRNYRKLAEAVGTSPNMFSYLRHGKIENPNPELLRRISTALTGEQDLLPKIFAESHLGVKALTHDEYRRLCAVRQQGPEGAAAMIPVLSPSSRWQAADLVAGRAGDEARDFIPNPDTRLDARRCAAFRIPDAAMSPRFLPEDFVITQFGSPVEPGKTVLFQAENRPPACRLWRQAESGLIFLPLNPSFEVEHYDPARIRWMHPVLGLYRQEP